MTPDATSAPKPVDFDEVKVGDALAFNIRLHDWSGTSIERRRGTVTRITAKCVYIGEQGDGFGYRLTRRDWRDRWPCRVAERKSRPLIEVLANDYLTYSDDPNGGTQ